MGGVLMEATMLRIAEALERISGSISLDQAARISALERSRDGWAKEANKTFGKNQKLRKQIKLLGRKPIA